MEITIQMLEEKKKEYEQLTKEYADIHYREELYRVAIGLAKHSVSLIDAKKHTMHKVQYEREWRGATMKMENAPDSVIATGVVHEQSIETYKKMFEDVYAGKPSGVCVIRAQDSQGTWSWLKVSYKTLFDQEGHPLRAVCYSENITQKREAEKLFDQFKKIVSEKSNYFYQINLTQNEILKVSEDFTHPLGIETGMSYAQLYQMAIDHVSMEYQAAIKAKFERLTLLQKFYDGERKITTQYEYIWPETHRAVWAEAKMYLLMNTDSEVYGILSIRNIETEKTDEQKRVHTMQFDQLCPVLKRSTFEQEMLIKMRKKEDLTLLMIDVDKFKYVNDQYGHAFGDEVLVRISEVINSVFRRKDLVARFGGDEFCVLMTGKINPAVLKSSASLLLDKVRRITFENGYQASLSIGGTQWNQQDSAKKFFEKADKQLYIAKKTRGTCSF